MSAKTVVPCLLFLRFRAVAPRRSEIRRRTTVTDTYALILQGRTRSFGVTSLPAVRCSNCSERYHTPHQDDAEGRQIVPRSDLEGRRRQPKAGGRDAHLHSQTPRRPDGNHGRPDRRTADSFLVQRHRQVTGKTAESIDWRVHPEHGPQPLYDGAEMCPPLLEANTGHYHWAGRTLNVPDADLLHMECSCREPSLAAGHSYRMQAMPSLCRSRPTACRNASAKSCSPWKTARTATVATTSPPKVTLRARRCQ